MNTVRNLPILLSENDDGTMIAECPFLPGLKCFGFTRAEALSNMQSLVQSSLRTTRVKPTQYEVVHLALERMVEKRYASGPVRALRESPSQDPRPNPSTFPPPALRRQA